MATMPNILEAALAYPEQGWYVFPCLPRSKAPATLHGFKDATLDSAQIRRWWADNPNYNIGLDCGRSGLAVIDVDPRNSGADNLATLEREYGSLPDTVMSLTGAGGQHYLYRAPENIKLPSKLAPGIDLKADGGYIIAPPSIHPNGQPYRWDAGAHPDYVPLASLPSWILELAQKTHVPSRNGHQPIGDTIPEGQRDATLTRMAGIMRRQGMSAEEMVPSLLAVNTRRCTPPLPEEQVRKIAWSVERYEPGYRQNVDRVTVSVYP